MSHLPRKNNCAGVAMIKAIVMIVEGYCWPMMKLIVFADHDDSYASRIGSEISRTSFIVARLVVVSVGVPE